MRSRIGKSMGRLRGRNRRQPGYPEEQNRTWLKRANHRIGYMSRQICPGSPCPSNTENYRKKLPDSLSVRSATCSWHGCGRSSGGKNPELTECQVHDAIAACIPSWWLGQTPPRKRLERTAAKIRRAQQRNALARKCHTKRTRRKLHKLGIKLTELPRCTWGKT